MLRCGACLAVPRAGTPAARLVGLLDALLRGEPAGLQEVVTLRAALLHGADVSLLAGESLDLASPSLGSALKGYTALQLACYA